MKHLFILFICCTFVFTSPSFFLQDLSPISTAPILRSLSSTKADMKCFYVDTAKYSVYNLHVLKKDKPYELVDKETEAKYYFNFCENVVLEDKNYNSTFVKCESNECKAVTESIDLENTSNTINILEQELSYSLGILEAQVIKNITFQIKCNKEKAEFNPELTFNNDKTEIIITGEHKGGCELVSFYSVTQFLEQFWYLTTVVTVIIGIILCFWGSKFINLSMIIILGLAVPIILSIFIFDLFNIQNTYAVFGVYLGGIIVGVILGLLIAKYEKFFGAIIGGALGYLSNIFVYNLALRYIETSSPEIMYYIVLVLCIVVCAALGYYFISKVKIIGTSVIGGYSIVRGISFIAGGFVSEQIIFDLLSHKEMEQLDKLLNFTMFLYLGGWIFLSGIGCYIQFNVTSPDNKRDQDEPQTKSRYQQIKEKQNKNMY